MNNRFYGLAIMHAVPRTIADLDHIDVLDPHFVNGDAHATYRWLRLNHPVVWDRRNQFWIVSRYRDIVAISKDVERFTTTEGTMPRGPQVKLSMLTETGERHRQLRRLVAPAFTPKTIALLETRMREVARESVDAVGPLGACDFLSEVAAPLPLIMITEMLGIDRDDVPRFRRWSSGLIGSEDGPNAASDSARGQALLDCVAHFREVLASRRSSPRNDIMTTLVGAVDAGRLLMNDPRSQAEIVEALAEDDLMQFMLLLVVAGHESTRNMVARAMIALLDHPEELARIRSVSSVSPEAVEELLR
jgi:cytochrome P450